MTEAKTNDENANWPSLSEGIKVWFRVALLSFGGPAGQIAVMHRIVVEEKRWLDEARFLHSLNFCMLLPGPEAQQLATYIGWLIHKTKGGLIAGGLFVLPGFLAIMALSYIYVAFGELSIVAWLFFGLKAAVLVIVFLALQKIGKRILSHNILLAIAVLSFVAIFVFGVPFPLIILTAGVIGFIGASMQLNAFKPLGHGPINSNAPKATNTLLGDSLPAHAQVSFSSQLKLAGVLLLLWLVPVLLLLLTLGDGNVFTNISIFFSKMAVVTFGGAYAVLAYVAQAAVDTYGWLKPDEMLDGLGMAETTPGPLIMVTQFVGFMGAYRDPGAMNPMLAASLGAILTTWVTFIPCFLWIFIGAPFIEKLRASRTLSGALTAITAAVVGVIANLAVWFAMHYLFNKVAVNNAGWLNISVPSLTSINIWAVVLSMIMFAIAWRVKLGSGWLVLIAGLLGCGAGFAGLLT